VTGWIGSVLLNHNTTHIYPVSEFWVFYHWYPTIPTHGSQKQNTCAFGSGGACSSTVPILRIQRPVVWREQLTHGSLRGPGPLLQIPRHLWVRRKKKHGLPS
jgi:hypothetical protein